MPTDMTEAKLRAEPAELEPIKAEPKKSRALSSFEHNKVLERARSRAFSVAYQFDAAAVEAWHRTRFGDGEPFDLAGYELIFRLEMCQLNDRLTLNNDGSSYQLAVWEHHEKELSCLSLKWPVTLNLLIAAEVGDSVGVVKCFRAGRVLDWSAWPAGQDGVLVNGASWLASRSPRPCPQAAEEVAN